MFVTSPVLESPPFVVKQVQPVSVVEYVTHAFAVKYAHASLVVDSTHRRLRVSSYHKNSGANSLPNSDSADLETETGVHGPDRAEGPWSFHSCKSWTCLLF